eukprot:m.230678 g.230678  ORF g.230678 m.230678 type:complete len:352 (+) comp10868_c0_seq36:2324-3379(+)
MQFCLLGSAMRARRRSLARCASCGMRSREGGVAAAHGLPLRLVLHCQLVDGAFPNTVTSTVENTAPLTLGSKQCRLVDIPGHERLRASLLDKFAASASKIVFVIDAISFPSQALNVAEWAYQVLTHPAMSKVPILFACNKQEVVTADTPRNIQNRLQEELETLRSTQSGQLISTDGTTIARSLGVEVRRPASSARARTPRRLELFFLPPRLPVFLCLRWLVDGSRPFPLALPPDLSRSELGVRGKGCNDGIADGLRVRTGRPCVRICTVGHQSQALPRVISCACNAESAPLTPGRCTWLYCIPAPGVVRSNDRVPVSWAPQTARHSLSRCNRVYSPHPNPLLSVSSTPLML